MAMALHHVLNTEHFPTRLIAIAAGKFDADLRALGKQIKALPGVATSNAANNNRIYRIEENVLNYFGPRSGENIAKVAALIHQK